MLKAGLLYMLSRSKVDSDSMQCFHRPIRRAFAIKIFGKKCPGKVRISILEDGVSCPPHQREKMVYIVHGQPVHNQPLAT